MVRGWKRDFITLFFLPFRMRFSLPEVGGKGDVAVIPTPRVANSECAGEVSAHGLRYFPFLHYSSYNWWAAPHGGAREALPAVSPTSQCQHCTGSRDMWNSLWKTGKNKCFAELKLFLPPLASCGSERRYTGSVTLCTNPFAQGTMDSSVMQCHFQFSDRIWLIFRVPWS